MIYSIEPKDQIYMKGYGFMTFTKRMSTHLSNKYSQKTLDTAKKSATDAIKTASRRAIQKTAEAIGDLIGNKITDKVTNVSKQSNKELPREELNTHKKRYVSPEERKQIINELRLIPKKDTYIS